MIIIIRDFLEVDWKYPTDTQCKPVGRQYRSKAALSDAQLLVFCNMKLLDIADFVECQSVLFRLASNNYSCIVSTFVARMSNAPDVSRLWLALVASKLHRFDPEIQKTSDASGLFEAMLPSAESNLALFLESSFLRRVMDQNGNFAISPYLAY